MHKRLLSFLLLVNVFYGYSQQLSTMFSHITTEDGLTSSWVRSIYQDKDGFMWFGTGDGLNRYDGYSIKAFKADPQKENSLMHGAVTCIAEKSADELWICTEQGVNILNLLTYSISDFPYLNKVRITDVFTDHYKLTWFSSLSGIYCYDDRDSSLTNYRNITGDSSSLCYDQVKMVREDDNGNLWVATQNGLSVFIRNSRTFYHYIASGREGSIYGKLINYLIPTGKGRMWVGLADAGVDLMELENNDPYRARFIHITDTRNSCLLIDNNNTLWMGNSLGKGISLLDLNKLKLPGSIPIITIRNTTDDINGLSDNTISSLFQDRDGGIWIGTFAGGVNYFSPFRKKFNLVRHIPGDRQSLNNNVVNCFLEDGNYLWVGTEEGLCRYNRETNKFKTFLYQKENSHSIGANGIICMLKDSKGNLWIGTWTGGLNLFNYERQDFKRFQIEKNNPGSINSNNVYALLEDSRGNLWVGTNGGGLNQYDRGKNIFYYYMPNADDPNSIFHNAVNDIFETSNGELFISLYHAMDVFDFKTGTFKHYVHNDDDPGSISSGNIIDIYEDSRKNLWIATSNGLNYFDRKSDTFRHYNTSQGFPSNSIQAINEDANGNLWISTNKGLVRFESGIFLPENVIIQCYSARDGLQGNEFMRRSTYTDKLGNMYFGGSKGYTWFHPDSIRNNPNIPEIVLTDFRLFNVNNSTPQNQTLNKNINHLNNLVLSYDQSDFTIRYAALNYLNSLNNEYQYILEGYEKKWHTVGNQHEATYTNIDPGRYVFKVRGSNNDGVWSVGEKSLAIRIKPPWWNTVLSRVIFVLVLLNLIYVLYRSRVRLLTSQKGILEEKVKERTKELLELNTLLLEKQEEISIQNDELTQHRTNLEKLVEDRTMVMKAAQRRAEEADRLKSAFLANMSHEIRTPMNAIVGFSNLLSTENLDEIEKKEFIDIILSNCEILMVLINDILEISLIEANQLKLKNQTFSVTKLLTELESYFRLNNKKHLEISFINRNEGNDLSFYNDPIRFRQVFVNLINNAYKYTEKGSIEFGYELKDNEITFLVKDTGIGIAESEYANIFNYFHKIDKGDNQIYRGAGIGLSICNKLVELMGGKIWLISKLGVGTTFYFTFASTGITSEVAENTRSGHRQKVRKKLSLMDKTIIIAEDEPANFILVEKILRKTQANILWAKNGLEAVEMLKNLALSENVLVLMDIKMPVMNGVTASDLIRKYNPSIPVIAVTAYAQHQNRDELMQHNFVDYIPKPLKPQKLLSAIYRNI